MPNSNIFIAVDCGKYDTKTAYYKENSAVKHFKYRTKVGSGIFEDDMLKKGTAIVQVDDGDILTFGYGAPNEPIMETSKKTDTHKTATLASIAMALGNGEFSDVNVAIGMPLDIANNAVERMKYKNFILGEDNVKHTVRYRTYGENDIHTVSFVLAKKYVYPEGCGALWMFPEKCMGSTAIIDIGNLNTNNIYAEALNPEDTMCFTGELGGKILISGLAQALEAELGARVAESMVAQVLTKPDGQRHLVSAKGNKEIEEKSGKIIADYALQHVKLIKQQCDVHHWPLEFANIVCVGGTVKLLERELRAVFGEGIFIPDDLEYVNVRGFLRRMCASLNVDCEEKDV